MLHASPSRFDDAVAAFERHADRDRGSTEAMTVAMVRHHPVDSVPSFHDDFDGTIDRHDPATVAGDE